MDFKRPLPLDWPGVINTSSKSFDATSEECEVLQDITVFELAASGLCKPNRVTSHWVYSAILNQCVADWVGLGQQRRKVGKEEKLLGRKGMMWDSAELLRSLSLRCASTSERNNWAARVSTEWVFVWRAWCQSCRPASLNVNTMDQSVAIQETLEREENCIMVSFPTHTHWFVVDQRIKL